MRGERDAAIVALEEAVRLDPDRAEARHAAEFLDSRRSDVRRQPGASVESPVVVAPWTALALLVLIGLLAATVFCLCYHLLNGIRHLVWDTGRGFEKRQADRSAWFVILFAVFVTAAFCWAIAAAIVIGLIAPANMNGVMIVGWPC